MQNVSLFETLEGRRLLSTSVAVTDTLEAPMQAIVQSVDTRLAPTIRFAMTGPNTVRV